MAESGCKVNGGRCLPGFGALFLSPVSTKKRLASGLSAIRPLHMDIKRKTVRNVVGLRRNSKHQTGEKKLNGQGSKRTAY